MPESKTTDKPTIPRRKAHCRLHKYNKSKTTSSFFLSQVIVKQERTPSTALQKRTKILSCDMYFQQCGILTSVDLDESAQPPLRRSISKLGSARSSTVIEYSSDKQSL